MESKVKAVHLRYFSEGLKHGLHTHSLTQENTVLREKHLKVQDLLQQIWDLNLVPVKMYKTSQ